MEKEMVLEILKSDPKFSGLDIHVDERRNKVSVFGFSNTPDWQVCKSGLEAMGFQVMAGSASKMFPMAAPKSLADKFDKMTPEQQAEAIAHFNKMATGR